MKTAPLNRDYNGDPNIQGLGFRVTTNKSCMKTAVNCKEGYVKFHV